MKIEEMDGWCNVSCCLVTKQCLAPQHHGLQHARLIYSPVSPGVFSDSCPWYNIVKGFKIQDLKLNPDLRA